MPKAMFQDLLEQTELQIDQRELELPVSVDSAGTIVTMRDLIDAKAPIQLKRELGRWPITEPPGHEVCPVRDLKVDELRRLAEAVVEASDQSTNAAVVGYGDFSPKQLVDEIRNDSDVGRRLVDTVRTHSLFVESAIEAGKVQVIRPHTRVILPKFDF